MRRTSRLLAAALALGLAAPASAKPKPRPPEPKAPSVSEFEAAMRQIEDNLRRLEETQKALDDLVASFGLEISSVASVPGKPLLPPAPNFKVRPAGRGEVLVLKADPAVSAEVAAANRKAPKARRLRVRALTGNADKTKDKFVVLDFWASWCGPCRASMPLLERIHRDYRAKGVEVVGIAVNTKPEDFRKLAKGLTYALAHDDADGSAAGAYEVAQLPTLLVVDPEGRIVHREEGVKPSFDRDLRALLDALLQNP